MKKHLLFGLLFAFSIVNAQVTSTNLYQPWKKYGTANTQFTTGVTRTSSLIAIGTLSVGSTATVTGNALFSSSVGIGALPTSSLSSFRLVKGVSTIDLGAPGSSLSAIWLNASTPNTSNYALYEDASNTFVNAKSGQSIFFSVNASNIARVNSSGLISLGTFSATGASTITGALTAQSTMSLGSANLTGGNTGTVAVLSDVLIPYDFKCAAGANPVNATTYYFSNVNQPWFTSASANSVLMPYKATLIGYHINYIVNGTLGSSETATLQITASGSSTNILTSLTFSDVANSYTSSATSINVSAGDLISARLNTPTWGTPPTNIRMGITFLFVRRP